MDTARKTTNENQSYQINIPKDELIITEYSEIIHLNSKLVGDNAWKITDNRHS